MIPVISIVASSSNSGKTTVLCRIIQALKAKGYKVATLKHDVHGFEIDHEGKDTWKHRKAGSDIVMISSAKQFAMVETVEQEYSLDSIVSRVEGVDIIFTEGYKNNHKPKIEIYRNGVSTELISKKEELIAIVSDSVISIDEDIPQFSFCEIDSLTEYIEKNFIIKSLK